MKKEIKKHTLLKIGIKKEIAIAMNLVEGLQQNFLQKDKKIVALYSVLTEKDFWQTNGKNKKTILIHDAVKKIADIAGISKSVKYNVLTQPDAYNNYQYTIQAEVCRDPNDCANEIGEANRSNLGNKGRGNPANMAQKRAYDRAVFRLLGITGLLSEEELTDEETNNTMDELNHEEKKRIAPVVNQLLLATNKDHLIIFNRTMKENSAKFTEIELNYLRKLYKKKVGELSETKF